MSPLKSLELNLTVYKQYYYVYTMVDFSVGGERIHFPQENYSILTLSIVLNERSYGYQTLLTSLG